MSQKNLHQLRTGTLIFSILELYNSSLSVSNASGRWCVEKLNSLFSAGKQAVGASGAAISLC